MKLFRRRKATKAKVEQGVACPHCGGPPRTILMLSNPPQLVCKRCERRWACPRDAYEGLMYRGEKWSDIL